MADGMIALVPTPEDAHRLAVQGGLPAEELHVTVAYLDDVAEEEIDQFFRIAGALAGQYAPFTADAFNVSMFNPRGEDPCIVLGLGGRQLNDMHQYVTDQVGQRFPQRSPYIPHLTLRYTENAEEVADLTGRTGPVRFDRIRLAVGERNYYFPMNPMGASLTAAVNDSFWKSWPVAPREQKFNADDAIARIMQWSGGSATKFNSAFLFRRTDGQPQNPESYRLPIADVINGRLTLIPRAVFSAAVILSGGHGGLEGVVDEDEREELKNVLNQIYAELQADYQDPRVRPPWLLGRTTEEREEDEKKMAVEASLSGGSDNPVGRGVWNGPNPAVNFDWSGLTAAVEKHPWDGNAARHRVWDWADGDYRKFRRAFLWSDPGRPEQKNSYKLPVADVVDGELRIVPRALSTTAALLAGARTSIDIPDRDMDDVEAVVKRLQDNEEESVTAAAPVRPPYQWFMEPIMNGPEPLTVSADGQVRGLIASFNRCHAGIMDECVMAPRSATGYKYFLNGQVMTADGRSVKVGKITMGTGHAGPNMRWMPAADHYDNTGTAAAVVAVGENSYGIWAAGSVVSSMTEEQIQELRRSPISGDWRRVDGSLELVAALAVNTPGFPIIASINGEPQSILAAGVMLEDGTIHASAEPQEDLNDVEKDLTRRVDELDDKLTQLAIRGRGRRLAKVLAALDERKK